MVLLYSDDAISNINCDLFVINRCNIKNIHIYSKYTISNYSAKNKYLHNKYYLLNGVVPTLAFLTQQKLFFAYFTTKPCSFQFMVVVIVVSSDSVTNERKSIWSFNNSSSHSCMRMFKKDRRQFLLTSMNNLSLNSDHQKYQFK